MDQAIHPRTAIPRTRLRHIALGVIAMVGAAQAQAQRDNTSATAENTVVVTGFRESLNNALNIKKNSDGIIAVSYTHLTLPTKA